MKVFYLKNYFPPTCKSVLLYGKWYPGALKKQYFAIAPSSESLDWSYNKTNQLEYMTPEITLSSLTLIQPVLATCRCNSTFRVPCTRLYLKRSNKLWCCTSGLTSYVNVTYSTYHSRLNRHNRTLQVITKTQGGGRRPWRERAKTLEGAWLSLLLIEDTLQLSQEVKPQGQKKHPHPHLQHLQGNQVIYNGIGMFIFSLPHQKTADGPLSKLNISFAIPLPMKIIQTHKASYLAGKTS